MKPSSPFFFAWAGLLLGCLSLSAAPMGPSLKLEPNRVASEGEVRAYGSGFCVEQGCSAITLRLQGWTVVEELYPDSEGSFEATFVADAGAGTYRVTAMQSLGDPAGTSEVTSVIASAELVIEFGPRLLVDPTEVRVGDVVTVWAVDLPADESALLVIKLGQEVMDSKMEKREDGTLAASFVVPLEPGIYEVSVSRPGAEDGETLAKTELIVAVGSRTPETEPEGVQ